MLPFRQTVLEKQLHVGAARGIHMYVCITKILVAKFYQMICSARTPEKTRNNDNWFDDRSPSSQCVNNLGIPTKKYPSSKLEQP
ncbi:predicted protein [Botrytis cinerea T4]|uniref:Uncharacterized protein n=1 Tax=Botryotinia fuckeliana (strain T4) TaxID=999810 RepID=G2YMI5_BOTF4|nr:predicted protein [Botrytis cinerea T4]